MTKDRFGNILAEDPSQERTLRFFYRTVSGRMLLRVARSKWVSVSVGKYMDSSLSAKKARRFIKKHNIDLADCEKQTFRSYNDFFTRKRKSEALTFSGEDGAFLSPADSRLTVVPLREGVAFPIKQAPYTVARLLEDEENAKRFCGGYALVFRLCVTDYHRYSYPDDGVCRAHKKIKGTFHTVNPIALETVPVFHANAREVELIDSVHFGTMAMIEVGAMLVGKIVNHRKERFSKGEEKGYFEFGGSTVVVLVEPNTLQIDPIFTENSASGIETYVHIGEAIGRSVRSEVCV